MDNGCAEFDEEFKVCDEPFIRVTIILFRNPMLNFSIPMEIRNGRLRYSECKMYLRNYSEVLPFLHSMSVQDLVDYENYYTDNLQPITNEEYEIVSCTDGWNYDRTIFPNTVVMEVCLLIFTINLICSLIVLFLHKLLVSSGIWCVTVTIIQR